jgi:hypothetical protein
MRARSQYIGPFIRFDIGADNWPVVLFAGLATIVTALLHYRKQDSKFVRKIAIVTCDEAMRREQDWALGDKPLYTALHARRIPFDIVAWDDPVVDWSRYAIACVRSTFNYASSPRKALEFRCWLAHCKAAGVTLYNDERIISWNISKQYLSQLNSVYRVPIIPTVIVPVGDEADLSRIVASHGWSDIIMKPAIGNGSAKCLRVNCSNSVQMRLGQRFLADMVGTKSVDSDSSPSAGVHRGSSVERIEPSSEPEGPRDMLVQPYLKSVETDGELSVVVIDGVITHAVQKRPAQGDFRCQAEWGATATTTTLLPEEHALVHRTLRDALRCVTLTEAPRAVDYSNAASSQGPINSDTLLFARLDFLRLTPTRANSSDSFSHISAPLLLLELELIEPVLYFDLAPEARTQNGEKSCTTAEALAVSLEKRYSAALSALL